MVTNVIAAVFASLLILANIALVVYAVYYDWSMRKHEAQPTTSL